MRSGWKRRWRPDLSSSSRTRGPIPRNLSMGHHQRTTIATTTSSGYGPRLSPGRRPLFHLLAEGRAEGVAGIDADDAEFARKEFQLLQREGDALVMRMAVDIGVELGG